MKKVFFIGMNRTATKAFSELFKQSGYVSFHYACHDRNGNTTVLAQKMKDNKSSYYNILHDIDHAHVYSDMFWHREDEWIDGVKYFRDLYSEHRDAYFILQTRDMYHWLLSKKKHKDGAYLARCKEYHNLDDNAMMNWFESDRSAHHDAVRKFFDGKPNFLEFDIDRDDIRTFIDFVRPDFFLNKDNWKKV